MTTQLHPAPSTPGGTTTTAHARRRARAVATGAATLLPAAVWLVAHALGAGFVLTDSQGTATIGLPVVLAFSLLFALLGWGSLALMERRIARAATWWTALAVTVALLSLVPVFVEQATGGTKAALALIHLAVAVAPAVSAQRVVDECLDSPVDLRPIDPGGGRFHRYGHRPAAVGVTARGPRIPTVAGQVAFSGAAVTRRAVRPGCCRAWRWSTGRPGGWPR
jgi:hypothetical protein